MTTLSFRTPLNHPQLVNTILTIGNDVTLLVVGTPGSAKSQLLHDVAARLPTHHPVYCDVPLLDVGDIGMNLLDKDTSTLKWHPQNYLTQSGKPLLIMFDEYLKAAPHMRPVLATAIHEKRFGEWKMPKGSIVFATSNNVSDGLGDRVIGHEGNRLTIVRKSNPTAEEYCLWGRNNDIHPAVLTWAEYNPAAFMAYTDSRAAEANGMIFHPKNNPVTYVSCRSASKASNILHQHAVLGDDVVRSLLDGTVGEAAANTLFSMARLDRELPKVADAIAAPTTLAIPSNHAAQLLFMNNCIAKGQVTTTGDLTAVVQYVSRFENREFQGAFYHMVATTEHLRPVARGCNALRQWGGRNIDLL